MNTILIKNANIVNEGETLKKDVLIQGEMIVNIDNNIEIPSEETMLIDGDGKFLLPGIIDDQVHFREPGLTHKADIASESRAAAAGGITSYIEMPNTIPQSTTQVLLEEKFKIAAQKSYTNYSFMFGGTNDNLDELLKTDPDKVAAIKLFLGSSTGNMLVDDEDVLEKIFSSTKMLIAVHCEDEATIKYNLDKQKNIYGDEIPIELHPIIRSEQACYISSSKAIELAKKTGARLHVFHVSTAKETNLFTNKIPLEEKKITAEVCVHHLWFDDTDYAKKGTLIKWNPAVKYQSDQDAIWEALNDDRIDVLATDHAPHTIDEKNNNYFEAPSGGPLVQHAMVAILEKVKEGKITIERAVEKMSHAPAICFQIEKRGFVREGYFADLVVVNPQASWTVEKSNILSKCGWSPFEDDTFSAKVEQTFINGKCVFKNDKIIDLKVAKRLTFER